MAYKIDPNTCQGCGACMNVCPVTAISVKDGKYWIDPTKCIECGSCVGVCPTGAISKDEPKAA